MKCSPSRKWPGNTNEQENAGNVKKGNSKTRQLEWSTNKGTNKQKKYTEATSTRRKIPKQKEETIWKRECGTRFNNNCIINGKLLTFTFS